MNFYKMDMEKWNRKDVFKHFMNDVRCVLTLTVEMDVTNLIQICKEQKYKFYPMAIYLVAKTVNQFDEFKMGYNENGELGVWEHISPSYIVFHPEEEAFTRLVTDYLVDPHRFYHNVLNEIENNKTKRGLEISYSQKNTFDISCLPWLTYKSFDMHIFDSGTYLAPVITWGKYERKNICL